MSEWLAWHHIAGFDAAIVFDHESTDGTAGEIKRMGRVQDIRYHPWTLSGGGHRDAFQTVAYTLACQTYGAEFDWIMFLDADEFFVLQNGTLANFLTGFDGVEQVAVPWAIFGSSGHIDVPTELIIQAFTRRAVPDFLPNRHVKTIVRPSTVHGWPNPHAPWTPGRLRDSLGRPVGWDHCPGIFSGDPDYRFCQVNHYMTRSRAHWSARIARQSITSPSRSWEEFAAYDRNEIEDRIAADRSPAVLEYLANPALEL